jgi:uncharacterized protein YndB with AHSA1/START domain
MPPSNENASAQVPIDPDADLVEFAISRLFDAPREQVFAAWTNEEHLKHWLAPRGFTIPVARLNLVPGGALHYCMRAPNGSEMWGKWALQEIEAPKWIVLVNTFSNKHGNLTRHPYVPNWPLEILTTTIFTEQQDKTLVKIVCLPINATDAEQRIFDTMHEAMTQGWNGTLDQLTEYLSSL